jgi:hypothetical protein
MFFVPAAANPDQVFELHAAGSGRWGIKRVACVQQHTILASSGRGGKDGIEQRSAAGRRRPDNLGDASAGKAPECNIHLGNAARNAFRRGRMTPAEREGLGHRGHF